MEQGLVPFFLLFPCPSASAQGVPTPDMKTALPINRDSQVKWVSAHSKGNETHIIVELVPEGQSLKAWKEMLANQITFTRDNLKRHVDDWKTRVRKADPKVEIEGLNISNSSITVIYRTKQMDEYSVRKFLRGTDGIYVIAYHNRLSRFNRERADLWISILKDARLVPKPPKMQRGR